MPHYDESFIHDDNQNQRRNKRSYHVYKHGLNPLSILDRSDVLQALEERSTSVITRNIKNIKQKNGRHKAEAHTAYNGKLSTFKSPDIIIDHSPKNSCFDPEKYNDIRNNNVLTPCKSFDNLTIKQNKKNDFTYRFLRNGKSLQNLLDDDKVHRYYSPLENEDKNRVSRKGDGRNSYWLTEGTRKAPQRRPSRGLLAPGVGVYRQINNDGIISNKTENELCNDGGSGHRGSLRGANKLARRARSFKDDLLERISNMRSPGQQHPHLASGLRSHSPLSPKLRNVGNKSVTVEEGEVTPAKELERLVKEVTFGLKHFSDVITKRKLEMLPDNGTIVFESIANIHKAIKPYCNRSPQLTNAVKRLCTALAMLIRLCDEIAAISLRAEAANEDSAASMAVLQPEHVSSVVKGVTQAVEDVAKLAQQHMARPALSPRPPLVSPRASTQRNSLPDIPLTPKEMSLLTGEAAETGGVRASHSSESVLDAPDTPPPKPARPNRKLDLAPPLPPKRKSANDNSLLALSIDRLSLQSHSSGSLDSMLNVSNDEEPRSSDNRDRTFVTPPPTSDVVALCSCNNSSDGRASLESALEVANHNHNRFSNESGFVSVGHSELSAEHSFSSASAFSAHYSSHTDSTFDSTDCVTEMKCTSQSFESRMNIMNANISSTQYSKNFILASTASVGNNVCSGETPPELPAKTRRNFRADVQHHFPNVEIRQTAACSLHGEARPHTLADHHPPRPPPLPLKKKHIMAYMEMFGNCSHPPGGAAAAAAPDMFRHSIHTYSLASAQHSSVGGIGVRHQQLQRSIAQSSTVQHFGASQLSGSEDSVNATSCGTSPVPPEPPALPPKMFKPKQLQQNSTGNELLPPPSPRPLSHNSIHSVEENNIHDISAEDPYVTAPGPGKFPLDDEQESRRAPAASPVPSQLSVNSIDPPAEQSEPADSTDPDDIILQTDISQWLQLKPNSKDGPEVRGGHRDALVVLATKATKDFAYQEAFLATYRTFVSPAALFAKLTRRARHYRARTHELRGALSLLTRVVADLTMLDLNATMMQEIMDFIYWLVEVEELPIAKALRQILVDKQKQLHSQQTNNRYEYESPCYGAVSLRRDTLLDFKATDIAKQMTLLDAALFARITTAEVLSWPRDQSEESSPNLTRFTAHFNNMSYWARSRILEQDEAREREKYANKFLEVMKALRKIDNFNSYLALVSALDSPPVNRLGWPRGVLAALAEHSALIDSSYSFRKYRQALAGTQPPCIPYIGLILQDLTFLHIGNPDLLPDGSINFTKRWQQYQIMENMKRFQKEQYKYKRNERIQAMFNEFDDVLSEEAMWQISETIKPRGGRSRNNAPNNTATATATATAAP